MAVLGLGKGVGNRQIKIGGDRPVIGGDCLAGGKQLADSGKGLLQTGIFPVVVIAVKIEAILQQDLHAIGDLVSSGGGLGDGQIRFDTAGDGAQGGVVVIGTSGSAGNIGLAVGLIRILEVALIEVLAAGKIDAVLTGLHKLGQCGNDAGGVSFGVQQDSGDCVTFAYIEVLTSAGDGVAQHGHGAIKAAAGHVDRRRVSLIFSFYYSAKIHAVGSKNYLGQGCQHHNQTQNSSNCFFHFSSSYNCVYTIMTSLIIYPFG